MSIGNVNVNNVLTKDSKSEELEFQYCDDVGKYEKLVKIGQGTFGEVFKGRHKTTKKIVALKKILMENETEGFPITALREIRILQLLKHENVVNLIEICRHKASSYKCYRSTFYLVFDFCEHDLAGLLSNATVKFNLGEIKKVMQQLLNGLYFIHSNKILHRDMKAANVLITKNGILKLADFGLARALNSSKNGPNRYTCRVVTLWYRPPELLLGERNYGPAVDMWGAGCIMAEMWTRSPIMQGRTEQHQITLISQLCGSITTDVWPRVEKLELYSKMELLKGQKRKVKERLRPYVVDPYACDLIDKLLILDPDKRIDSDEALNHDFFWKDPMPCDLSKMLALHTKSMFEYLAPPRRGRVQHPVETAKTSSAMEISIWEVTLHLCEVFMYGLILESAVQTIRKKYGEAVWNAIKEQAQITDTNFVTHEVYPEELLSHLIDVAVKTLNVETNDFMFEMGQLFVSYVVQYGYDRVLIVLGRYLRDFLNGLDNLHEYLRFSYPQMNPPSFFCENETKNGLTLHYRSKRSNFVYYTMGQITKVAKKFYDSDISIVIVKQEKVNDINHVIFDVQFDNKRFEEEVLHKEGSDINLTIHATTFFEIFPFSVAFGSDMVIRTLGKSLATMLNHIIGKKITESFSMVRPLIDFKYDGILRKINNIFELLMKEPLKSKIELPIMKEKKLRNLHLKGQMMYMKEWKMIVYLATPMISDLNAMIETGFYINDLSMHDFSRDLMLAGTQQSVELKLALDQEQLKSKRLEESMRKLDEEMKRTDELLYQMIPKQVADRLRAGENPVDTCQISSRITPLEVVSLLNSMYSIFDRLTEKHGVYKVETIGDAYMIVSGAPEENVNHAELIGDMALDMIEAILGLVDPSTGDHIKVRIGIHSGSVVAGIVGLKMPRYCLFGDTVNTANRMESNSEPMKILITQSTADLLPTVYQLTEKGEVDVKGIGKMKTFWLEDKIGRKTLNTETLLMQMPQVSNTNPPSRRSVYSPVTMEQIERRRSSIVSAYRKGSGDSIIKNSISHSLGKQRLSVPNRYSGPASIAKTRRSSEDTIFRSPIDNGFRISVSRHTLNQLHLLDAYRDKETQTMLRGNFDTAAMNGLYIHNRHSLKSPGVTADVCCASLSSSAARSNACTVL